MNVWNHFVPETKCLISPENKIMLRSKNVNSEVLWGENLSGNTKVRKGTDALCNFIPHGCPYHVVAVHLWIQQVQGPWFLAE